MASFELTHAARSDLLNIARYTQSQWGKAQRNRYLARFDAAFHRLAASPRLGEACDHVRPGYRKFPVGSHLIFYRLTPDGVRIVRILHQRMDVPSTLS